MTFFVVSRVLSFYNKKAMTKLPNLFIVGAPKCGTTAMHVYLSQHPEIYMSPHKEPTFFGKDLIPPCSYFIREWNAYTKLFEGAENYKVVGESSVYYLVSETAAREIHALVPDAKILIMIRNPIDMMYSLHAQFVYSGMEDETSFVKALALEPLRRSSDKPAGKCVYKALYYSEMARFSIQISRYIKVFGRDNVHVVLLEEFIENKEREYKKILSFLNVDATYLPGFSVINPSKRVRCRSLKSFLKSPPDIIRRAIRFVFPDAVRRSIISPLIKKIKDINTRVEPRAPLSDNFRLKIRAEFKYELSRLEGVLGRNLPY